MKFIHRFLTFDQLSLVELYQILAMRVEVFVVEQDCPYQDLDGLDQKAIHLVSSSLDGKIAATLRILPPGISFDCHAIGRVVTSPEFRGQGLGNEIMERTLKYMENHFGVEVPIKLSAQEHLKKYYENHGFSQCGDGYLEDGIPHIPMSRRIIESG